MKSLTEPEGRRGRGAAGGVESQGSGWSMPDQGGAGGQESRIKSNRAFD